MKWSRVVGLILAVVLGAFLFSQLFVGRNKPETKTLTEIAELAKEGSISEIVVKENDLDITLQDGLHIAGRKEPSAGIGETLRNLGVTDEQITIVNIQIAPPSRWGGWVNVLATLLPLILIDICFESEVVPIISKGMDVLFNASEMLSSFSGRYSITSPSSSENSRGNL